MNLQYKINIHCVVFGLDIPSNKKYILSLSSEDILFPSLVITKEHLLSLEESLINNLKQYVFVSDLELLPQLISLHDRSINEEENTVNVIYGFIIDKTININQAYWYEFDSLVQHRYSNLIFEVIQKLT